jgi:hypothetical protein
MLPRRIGLVARTPHISFAQLVRVAAALNVQVMRDLRPIWNISGSVIALDNANSIEPGIWPIFIEDSIPDNALGIHLTDHHQPYARVAMGSTWSLITSHECLEMLVDPSANQVVSSTGIGISQNEIVDLPGAKFEYLLEICDPSEHPENAYPIDDILVADFYTPNFFDPVRASGVRYSFTGKLTKPRHILPGGYISWFNPALGHMEQLRLFAAPRIVAVAGTPAAAGRHTLRGFIDAQTTAPNQLSDVSATTPIVQKCAARNAWLTEASGVRAREFDGSPTLTAAASVAAATPAPVPGDVLPRPSSFAERAAEIAIAQWEKFGKQTYDLSGHTTHHGHKEGEDPWYRDVGLYWSEGVHDDTLNGRDDVPWSAAFISWVMRTAGAGPRFRYNAQHSAYIARAIRDLRQGQAQAGYWCYRLNEQRPEPGDIVCWARQHGIDYDHQNGGDYKGHCDIVIGVGSEIEIIGGNVGNSVTRRPLALTPNGTIQPATQGGETLFGLMKCLI